MQRIPIPVFSDKLEDLLQRPSDALPLVTCAGSRNHFAGKEYFWEKQRCQLFGSQSVTKVTQERTGLLLPAEHVSPEREATSRDYFERLEYDASLQGVFERLEKSDTTRTTGQETGMIEHLQVVWQPRTYYRARVEETARQYFASEITTQDEG